MRNKKGFTLIELLAVIVILAVIALIATPIITGIIKDSKKSSLESETKMIVSAINNYCMAQSTLGTPCESTISSYEGILEEHGLDLSAAEIENDKVKSLIATRDCLTVTVEYDSTSNSYTYTPSEDCDASLDNTPTYASYETGDEILYDPTTGKTCTSVGGNCMRFYAIEDSDASKSTVDAILDHNTTALVAWNSSGNNADGMNEVQTALESDTAGWQGTPRLITANEVARITGNTLFDQTTSTYWFYLDSNSQTQTANSTTRSNYVWLFNNTNGCAAYGCSVEDSSTYGYWTSTPYAGGTDFAWNVGRNGSLGGNYVDRGLVSGVRPVITISKSIIS